MLTRRHIRVKVMQTIYAFNQSKDRSKEVNLDSSEKFLRYNMKQMLDLYLLLFHLLVELQNHAARYNLKLQKKLLATQEDKNPSQTFVENKIIKLIAGNSYFTEVIKNKKLDVWENDSEYVAILFNQLKEKSWYNEYLQKKKTSFQEDKIFIVKLYKEIIAPNDKLYEYLEDKRLTWLDDYPLVNTLIIKALGKMSANNTTNLLVPELFKNKDDEEFAIQLFRKVVLKEEELMNEIDGKTPNWDKDRIADIDLIILKMGIAEFLYFPSIPVRVSINEYLEVAKEYSTPKSSIFINGILDKLSKEYAKSGKLNKIGRGLQ